MNIELAINEDPTKTVVTQGGRTFGLVEIKGKKWWRPKKGEVFYYLLHGQIEEGMDFTDDDDDDFFNWFRTEADAQLHSKFVRATVEGMAREPKSGDWYSEAYGLLLQTVDPFAPNPITCPTFDTEERAEAYAALRKKACEMYRSYLV